MSAYKSDILIVGAGLSGIGAAAHLRMKHPGKSVTILEQRPDMGGTWDLFRYPGVRSDSDMSTLGYRFKPWRHPKSIAPGEAIRDYINETADEFDVRDHIRFNHKALAANWSSDEACWSVTARREADGSEIEYQASFLLMCAGYYNYEAGYRPDFAGEDNFAGQIIHPQQWPDDLDYSGKKVAVIGSGATAITIVPEMAQTAEKVTMLQRSPTWIIDQPAADGFANVMRRILPEKFAYALTRFKNIRWQRIVYWRARRAPEKVGETILGRVADALPDYPEIERDFKPSYGPWEQRLCLSPDGDFFDAVRSGKAEIATDHIDHFTQNGIVLKSGRHIDADIIVTATGLNLVLFGDTKLTIDGEPADMPNRFYYKGAMFSDIPNMVSVFGYINASWTLKTDIVCDYVCRLLEEMDRRGADIAVPVLGDTNMPKLPMVEDFSSGYFARSIDDLPKNGDRHPWRVVQNYFTEKKILTKEPVDDGVMRFSKSGAAASSSTNERELAEIEDQHGAL